MEPDRIWNVVTNPAWRPITDADLPGYVLLLACAAISSASRSGPTPAPPPARPKRIGILIALRLPALLLAVLLALRPAAAITEIPKLPSTLIIVVDSSESMSRQGRGQLHPLGGRPEGAGEVPARCSTEMREDQHTTIYVYHFSKDFDPDRDTLTRRSQARRQADRLRHHAVEAVRPAPGRTAAARADHRQRRAPTTARPSRPCPRRPAGAASAARSTGSPSAGRPLSDQKDIWFTSINPDPSPGRDQVRPQGQGQAQRPGLRGDPGPGSAQDRRDSGQGRRLRAAEGDGQRNRDRRSRPRTSPAKCG